MLIKLKFKSHTTIFVDENSLRRYFHPSLDIQKMSMCQGCKKRGQGGGAWPPIKSGQGAKKGHIFFPYLAYPLLTNISW